MLRAKFLKKAGLLLWGSALFLNSSTTLAQMVPFAFLRAPCRAMASTWTPQWASVIHYWPLNGTVGAISTGTTVTAAVGTNGTATSTGMAYAAGRVQQGVSFNGANDYISMGTMASLQGLAQFSVSLWVKPTSFPGNLTLVGKENLFKLQTEGSGTVYFFVSNSGSTWDGIATSSSNIPTGKWSHIVGVYNGANVIIYINGVNKGSDIMTGTTGSNGSAFQISGYLGANEVVAGLVDEVTIWNKGLTAAEVQTVYGGQLCNGN
jgi:hypothetical protein